MAPGADAQPPRQSRLGRLLGGSLQDLHRTHERTHGPWFGPDPAPAPHDDGPPRRAAPQPALDGRAAAGARPADADAPARGAAQSGASDPGAAAAPAPADAGGGIWAGRWRQRKPRGRTARIEQGSLFGEILDWMFAPLLLLWPLSVAITFLVARSLADAPFDRALDDRTEALAQQVRVAADRVVVILPRAARDFLAADAEDVVYHQVVGPLGRMIAGDADLPRPGLYDFPQPGRVKLRTTTFRGEQVRIGYMYLDQLEGDEIAPVLVQVAETLDKRTRLANEIIKGVIFPQFMILPVAVMLVWFGLSRGLAPLKTLRERIRARDPDDLSPIDPRAAPEEIAPLVDAFNEMLERLAHNVSAQKRFIADAAHQMKTPLAGLRTQTELALREPDPAELRRNLEQIARGSQRAAHLISQLLSLARMENLRDAASLVPVDLQPLAREVVSEWVPTAIERGIDLGFETVGASPPRGAGEAAVPISGHPILLRELMGNLLDNALRYTPRGGAVTLRVVADARRVHLEIEDTGPGIAHAERELVFERFYRVLGTGVDGSGLGLSIVREIADQHGATILVETARPGATPHGTRFTVTFQSP
jgi:two-component system sensor histidine kinase TctE